jgi:hypothetical protein
MKKLHKGGLTLNNIKSSNQIPPYFNEKQIKPQSSIQQKQQPYTQVKPIIQQQQEQQPKPQSLIQQKQQPQQSKAKPQSPIQQKQEQKPKPQSPIQQKQEQLKKHKQRKQIDLEFIKLKNDYKEIYETKKKVNVKNYKSIINYIRDYKYYKNKISYSKSSIISFSKFKTNLIKSRIYDYLNIDDFFTYNREIFKIVENKTNLSKKSTSSSSLFDSYSGSLFDSYSNISRGKKIKGGNLKADGIELLSVMHILDSKHDFYDNITEDAKKYMNSLYDSAIATIPDLKRKQELIKLYNIDPTVTKKDRYYEENILVDIITKISEGKYIEDINDFGNFQFIDVNNDSTKFIYYPTIDANKVQTEKNIEADTIVKNIRDYFGYNTNIDNYKYMYDTKIHTNDDISQVLSNKNTTVFSKIGSQCKPFENGYDPHPSNDIIIDDSDYPNFLDIMNSNFNSLPSVDEYKYATRNIVRKYINFTIIRKDISSNYYYPAIIFKNMANIPIEINDQYTDKTNKKITIKDCEYHDSYTINTTTSPITYNNIIIYTKSFNEKPKIKEYINKLVELINIPIATRNSSINDYVKQLLTTLNSNVSQEDFILKFIIIHCYYSSPETYENKIKDIINILFDLKKSGDWGQSLFCSKYNLKYHNKNCFFISGDKLSAARAIMEGNVNTVTATDYNSVFNTTDKGNEKRAVITLYRNGELMTFKYFIKFLQRNIFNFIAFKHMKIDFKYFINPALSATTDTDLITDANFNFTFFKYFIIIIIYQLRIFYNTYTIINLKTSKKINYEKIRYRDPFINKFKEQAATHNTDILENYFKFNHSDNNDILTSYINENIFFNINEIITNNKDTYNDIISTYLKIIDNYYDVPVNRDEFKELDKILITDIFRIVDTKFNVNLKVNTINPTDTSDIIYTKYNTYYNTNTSTSDKFLIINKFLFLEDNANDFSKCKNLINTISSYNNICAMLLVDFNYNKDNFISLIKNEIETQETEIKTMINDFKLKVLDFITILPRYFSNIGRFTDLAHDLLLDVHEDNLIKYIYLKDNIDKILIDVNKYLPEEEQNKFIFSYYSYGTIIRSNIQTFTIIYNDFISKIKDVWAAYPQLDLKLKNDNNTLSESEEKIYKDYIKFITPITDKPNPRKRKSAPNPASNNSRRNKNSQNIPLSAPAGPVASSVSSVGPPVAAPGTGPGTLKVPGPPASKKIKTSGPPPVPAATSAPAAAVATSSPAAVATSAPTFLNRSNRPRTLTDKGKGYFNKGGARKVKDRNKLSFRLYAYFLKNILSYYNYNLCYTSNMIAVQSKRDEIISSFNTNILLNFKLLNILCNNKRITPYSEILLFRILYLNKIIKNNINNLLLYIKSSIEQIPINLKLLNYNFTYMNNIHDNLSKILVNNDNIITIIDTLISITSYSKPITPQTLICKTINDINNTYKSNINIYDLIKQLNTMYKDTVINFNTNIIRKKELEDIFRNNTKYSIYLYMYERHITSNSNIDGKISKTESKIKRYKTDLRNSDVVIEYMFTYALYMYFNLIKSQSLITTLDNVPINISQIKKLNNNLNIIITKYEEEIKSIESDYMSKYDNETKEAIEMALLIYYFNLYLIKIIYLYVIAYKIFLLIDNKYKLLLINIDILDKSIYENNKHLIKKENIFLKLFNKQNDIEENITKLYKDHEQFKQDKANGKVAILIQKDLYPHVNTLFKKKDMMQNVAEASRRSSRLQNIKLSEDEEEEEEKEEKKQLIELEDGEEILMETEDGEEILMDTDDRQERQDLIIINKLYDKLIRKAAINSIKPNDIEINNKPLVEIYSKYFRTISNIGSRIITAEVGQGADTTGEHYNENIIIQNITFITAIANHFADLIKYKETKIFEIINTIEKDNTYKIHSFINPKIKNHYYNNDDFKIITLVYACLYNIIKIKNDAILKEKRKGRDKYNFVGYYNKKHKYFELEKIFSMFDLVCEITKFNDT